MHRLSKATLFLVQPVYHNHGHSRCIKLILALIHSLVLVSLSLKVHLAGMLAMSISTPLSIGKSPSQGGGGEIAQSLESLSTKRAIRVRARLDYVCVIMHVKDP